MVKILDRKNLMHTVATIAVVGAVTSVSSTIAQAGGFALREQSAIGQGSSFAGVAAGVGLSSMFWNPATLTQSEGTNTESVFSYVIPHTDVSNISTSPAVWGTLGDPGNVGMNALIPASYAGVQVTEDLYFGLSVNAPYGMATKADDPSATAFHSATAKIFTADMKANVAYRINDVFSVGAGVGATYGYVRMTSRPGSYIELKGTDWAPVYSAGVTITPREGTVIGIGYRSETKLELEGTETIGASIRNDITADLTLPASVTVGLRQRITDRFDLLAGFEWAGWSSVKDPIPIVGSPIPGNSLTLGYDDSWFASIGGEFAYNDRVTLRAGLAYEKSPIPDKHRNLRLPDANRIWASFGGSFEVTEKIGVDFGYTHLFIKDDVKVSGSNSAGSYSAIADSTADIISASLRYQWKPEPLFGDDDDFERQY